METSHHALIRALLFICWDISKKVIEDDAEWGLVCKMQRWDGRHIRPKLNADYGKLCHFIAHLIFSDATERGNDAASKKGGRLNT